MPLKSIIATAMMILSLAATAPRADEILQTMYEEALPRVLSPITLGRMIVGGEGMAILALGTPLDQVAADFGAPLDERITGFLGKNKHWLYRADDGTQIIVTGKDVVRKISLRGGENSTFMTVEGVGFGMEDQHVAAHYGKPELRERPAGVLHAYPEKGLEFMVSGGKVTQIIVRKIGED